MSKILLFNADDWGLSESIHAAIISLHQAKAIDAAGIMLGQEFTEQAVKYASEHPDLRVGPHLFATDRDCVPLSRKKWDTFWPEDIWINSAIGLPYVDKVILEETDAQLRAWKETGLPLHFVNSHFHFHAHRQLLPKIVRQILHHFPKFRSWIRLGDSCTMPGSLMDAADPVLDLIESRIYARRWQGLANDTLWGMDRVFKNRAEDIATAANRLGPGFHEFFFHPGRASNLSENGTDHAALMELRTLLPQEDRNLSSLPTPHDRHTSPENSLKPD